jgi:hypothetical protein
MHKLYDKIKHTYISSMKDFPLLKKVYSRGLSSPKAPTVKENNGFFQKKTSIV